MGKLILKWVMMCDSKWDLVMNVYEMHEINDVNCRMYCLFDADFIMWNCDNWSWMCMKCMKLMMSIVECIVYFAENFIMWN